MIRKVLAIIMVIIYCINTIIFSSSASEDYIPSENSTSPFFLEGNYKSYIDTYDLNTLNLLMDECQEQMSHAHDLAEAARALGYAEDHPIIILAKNEYHIANSSLQLYQMQYDKWMQKLTEYPEATKIWLYLKNLGYSDIICAGILGNIMAEVGGNTLEIQWWLYGRNHYGMCQWHLTFYRQVAGTDLQTQCNFLRDTIKYEFDTFGFKYYQGFNYDEFLKTTDYRNAALAFAISYERCDPTHYIVRQDNAKIAYDYFAN